MEILVEYFTKGMITMLMIAMPCVLTAAAVGLVVGILQAVTQVQEQTIAAAPKIFTVFLVIILFGMGYVKLLKNLFYEGVVIAFDVVPKSQDYVLPLGYYNYTKPFIDEMKSDVKKDTTSLKDLMNKITPPNSVKNKDDFSFEKARKSYDIPTPNLAEKKVIEENKR